MFNLIVGSHEGGIAKERFLESTSQDVRSVLGEDLHCQLTKFPALIMPEIGDSTAEQIAQIGRIVSITEVGKDIIFEFQPDSSIPPIATGVIEELTTALDADSDCWGWNRTRWSVKDVDLYEVLLKHVFLAATTSGSEGSSAISFPTTEARDSSLVAVMMPFDTEYDAVYDTIKEAVSDAGLYCRRVDDIWDSDHIMADVASLLWRAEVIVADLTGRNPNVFYEVGLSHALPRKTLSLIHI